MSNKVILGIVLVVIVIGAIIALGKKEGAPTTSPSPTPQAQTNPPTSTPTVSTSSAQPTTEAPAKEAMVTLTKDGFSPQTVTIKVGTKVTWTNKSGDIATVNSDPHPQHTAYPSLNLGEFNDGETLSFIFTKPGTYGYHNHLNPTSTGTVTVE